MKTSWTGRERTSRQERTGQVDGMRQDRKIRQDRTREGMEVRDCEWTGCYPDRDCAPVFWNILRNR
jgi:hypothetical protein